jgi:hypothetical protein
MKIDGIWRVEFYGVDGWERVGTALLENGRYFAASADHYSIGTYKKKKDKFSAKVRITQHGDVRVIFGANSEVFDAIFKGAIDENGQIKAKFHPTSGENFDVTVRLNRLGKLV